MQKYTLSSLSQTTVLFQNGSDWQNSVSICIIDLEHVTSLVPAATDSMIMKVGIWITRLALSNNSNTIQLYNNYTAYARHNVPVGSFSSNFSLTIDGASPAVK